MMKKIFFILICFSFHAFSSEPDLKPLMNLYLKSLAAKDLKSLKKITSDDFYNTLVNTKAIKKSEKSKNKFNFDMKIKKAAVSKNRYFISIKDKSSKHYSDYWYVVDKKDEKFIISELRMIEE